MKFKFVIQSSDFKALPGWPYIFRIAGIQSPEGGNGKQFHVQPISTDLLAISFCHSDEAHFLTNSKNSVNRVGYADIHGALDANRGLYGTQLRALGEHPVSD